MKHDHTRLFVRKEFDQQIYFETTLVNGKMKNINRKGIAMDISDGGLGLKTDLDLSEGAVVKFNIPMKEVDITIPVFAEVMWSKPENSHFRAGLRFLS